MTIGSPQAEADHATQTPRFAYWCQGILSKAQGEFMWDDGIDLERVRKRVKGRLLHRSSLKIVTAAVTGILAAVLILVIMAFVGELAGRASLSALPSASSEVRGLPWIIPAAIVLVIIALTGRLRRGLRSSRRSLVPGDDEIERAVRRELRHERRRMAGQEAPEDRYEGYDYDDEYEKPKRVGMQPTEKRKNESLVQLGDDGELIFDDEPQHSASRDNQ